MSKHLQTARIRVGWLAVLACLGSTSVSALTPPIRDGHGASGPGSASIASGGSGDHSPAIMSIDIINPGLGSTWTRGESETVHWYMYDCELPCSEWLIDIFVRFTNSSGGVDSLQFNFAELNGVAGNNYYSDFVPTGVPTGTIRVSIIARRVQFTPLYAVSDAFQLEDAPPPNSVHVSCPNNGGVWRSGIDPMTVRWTGGDPSATAAIYFRRTSVPGWFLQGTAPCASGQFPWTPSWPPVVSGLVQVRCGTSVDQSDSPFTVLDSGLPTNLGCVGDPGGRTLSWASSVPSGVAQFELQWRCWNGPWQALGTTTRLDWDLDCSDNPCGGAASSPKINMVPNDEFRVRALIPIGSADCGGTSTIQSAWTAASPICACTPAPPTPFCPVQVVTPNGGEYWTPGSTAPIRFEIYSPCDGGVSYNVQLSRNNGQSWTPIASVSPSPGNWDDLQSVDWPVTGPTSSQCRIKVVATDGSVQDASDATFSIANPSGGGCPYLFVDVGRGFVQENTLLGPVDRVVSGTDAADVHDHYLLQHEPAELDGLYRLELREFEQEQTWFDAVRLEAVDHRRGTKLAVDDAGRLMLYERELTPVKAVDAEGRDWLAAVSKEDGEVFPGTAGSVLDLEYEVGTTTIAGVGNPTGRFRVSTKLPSQPPPENPKPGSTPAAGIEVVILDDSDPSDAVAMSWSIVPREKLGERLVEFLGARKAIDKAAERLRVQLRWGTKHELDYAGLFFPLAETPRVTGAASLRALGAKGENVSKLLADSDGQHTTLQPGETLTLDFQAVDPTAEERDFVLRMEGHYVHLGNGTPLEEGSATRNPQVLAVSTTVVGKDEMVISVDAPQAGNYSLGIYSVTGSMIRSLANGWVEPGTRRWTWDGTSDGGRRVSAGVYFVRLAGPHGGASKRLVVVH